MRIIILLFYETAIVNFHENINEELQNIIRTIFDGKKGYLITGMPRKVCRKYKILL